MSACNTCRTGTITPAMVAREYATGKAYVHAHTDVYGRPVIVIRAEKHVTGKQPGRCFSGQGQVAPDCC